MKYRLVAALVFAMSGAAPGALTATASAAPPATARVMYTRAMAEERAIRDESSSPTLAQIHHAVASYEAIVRRHPASGYCVNISMHAHKSGQASTFVAKVARVFSEMREKMSAINAIEIANLMRMNTS